MGKYWLLDRYGFEGPTVLVETDGSMRVIDVLRFGTQVTELEQQQEIWDDVIDRVAPTMKPLVEASKISEAGIAAHSELQQNDSGAKVRARRTGGQESANSGRSGGGAKRTGGRGRG